MCSPVSIKLPTRDYASLNPPKHYFQKKYKKLQFEAIVIVNFNTCCIKKNSGETQRLADIKKEPVQVTFSETSDFPLFSNLKTSAKSCEFFKGFFLHSFRNLLTQCLYPLLIYQIDL